MRNAILLMVFTFFGCFAGVKTDTLAAKVNVLMIKDTTQFVKGLRFGNGHLLTAFDTGSFPCTLSTSYVTATQTGIVHYMVLGNHVTLSIPQIQGESNSTSLVLSMSSAPSIVKPSVTAYGIIGPVTGKVSGSAVDIFYITSAGSFSIGYSSTWNNSGTKGVSVSPGCFTSVEYTK